MYQAYDDELLNQKESKTVDSASILDKFPMPDMPEHPLFVATRRLVKSLDRLEGNLKSMSPPEHNDGVEPNEQVAIFQRENTALKQEREKLSGSIAHLQRQYNDLHRIASTIHDKLDDSIKRLTQIIEE